MAAAVGGTASGPASALAAGEVAHRFPSIYMNAADTPLVTIARAPK
jgi:hypothetical protein